MNQVLDGIDKVVTAISGVLYMPWVPFLLLAAGLFFTFRSKFMQVGESFRVVSEKPKTKGGISSFGALMVSTASRVGTGNIVGVSTAICMGGYGAVFWMWMTAILGGATSFIESTLAQVYKRKNPDGTYFGGPSYYMETALKKRWLGVIFAVIIILTYAVGYNMLASYNLQSSFSAFSFYHEGSTPLVIGIILALLFAVCVMGGAKRLTKITGALVPIMGIFYVAVAVVVVVGNASIVPEVFRNIFASAFDFPAIFGGFTGSCMMEGIKRGLYSNEAGMGSAPNAAATADVSHPAKQGLVQMLAVFIDTLLRHRADVPVLRRGAHHGGRRRPLCPGRPADRPGGLRPRLHRCVHGTVRLHHPHRQLLLLRGLPAVHLQEVPQPPVHDRLPHCSCHCGHAGRHHHHAAGMGHR